MSCSKWAYIPERCDGEPCPGDCDCCSKANDNVEMCRCKDCRWYDTEDGDLKCVKDADWDEDAAMYVGFVSYHLEDFYCADGQRREEELL